MSHYELKRFFSAFARHAIMAGCAVLILSASAQAQVPASVNPAIIEKRFEDRQPLNAAPVVNAPQPALQPVPQDLMNQMAAKHFVLRDVMIEGNTIFTKEQLRPTYADMIGREISLADTQTIVQRINDFYRSRQYILTQAIVPPQDVNNGILRVRVVEGYINNVVIEGDLRENRWRKLVESYGEEIKKRRPIRTADLERYLLLMDDLPGTDAKGLVRPSLSEFGAADLIVTLTHQTFQGSYTIDNLGSKYVGPWQHMATLAANSLFGMYDRTIVRAITTSPTTELRFFDIQHEEQLGHEGTRLIGTYAHSVSHPGDALKALDITGTSDFVQAKIIHPIIRSRAENLSVRFTADGRNTSTDSGALELNEDHLRVIRLGGSYDFADKALGVNLFDAEISQGLDAFGATDAGINRSRPNGRSQFTKINLDATRTQNLPSDFSLFIAGSAQYSFQPLLAGEQFTLGGPVYGRAYDPGELSGDHGLAGKVELRWGQVVGDPWFNAYQLYGFYDIGRVWIKNGGAFANNDSTLSSIGVGVRANFTRALSADLYVADPMIRKASNQGGHGGSPRIFVSSTVRF